jgi:hypothetical protein
VTPLYLIAALLIVAGLAMTVPPSSSSASDDHFGLILHPLLPHTHGVSERILASQRTSPENTIAIPRVEQKPGISGPTADPGGRDAVAGIVLPLLLAGLVIEIARRRTPADLLPEQRTLAPPFPPPRLSLVAV